jgi:PAS domain S-box-containing protein
MKTESNSKYSISGKETNIKKSIENIVENKNETSLWEEERIVFSYGNVVIFKWKNIEDWPIDYVSPNVVHILGYSQDEVSSPDFNFSNSIHPDDLERVRSEVELNYKQRKAYFEHKPYRLIRKDGEIRWVSDFTRIQVDKNGKVTNYVGYIVDITEQRYAEDSLLQEHELFHEILNNQPAGIYRLRVFPSEKWEEDAWKNSNQPPYIIELANNRFCEILGINNKILDRRPGIIFDLIYEDDKAEFKFKNEEANLKLITFFWKGRMLIDGKIKWVHIESQPYQLPTGDVLWTGYLNDITESKLAEEALSIEKRKLADIIRGTNVGCWEWNIKTGEAVYNNRWAEIIGYELEEISPTNFDTWIKFSHPDDFKQSYETLEKHIKGESDFYISEVRMKHKNGDWVWVYTSGSVCEWDKEGKPILMAGTHLDITNRKHAEEELKHSQEHLKKFAAHLQKVQEEEKVLLATEIDEELGQILVALKMDIGMLKQKALTGNVNTGSDELVSKLDNAYNMIGNSIRSTMKIMTDLRYEVLHLMGFIEACKLYSDEFQEKNGIKCYFESTLSTLVIDSQQSVTLFRILQDALNNIAQHAKATEVNICLYQKTDKLVFEINDNGVGFDTKLENYSNSFGIINMKERAILLKGKLNINSEQGYGTTIKLDMPYLN